MHLPMQANKINVDRSAHAGHDTSALVDNEGQAFFWGMGTNFQLGKASDRDERLPGRFKMESLGGKYQRVVQVSFGGQHTLLLAE